MKSCYKSPQDRMILGLSEVAANAVSVVACSFVILIIITYKKYQFIFQRLLLYLTVNLLLYSVVHILQGASYQVDLKCNHWQEKYCEALGFLFLFILLCIRVSIVCIVLELYLCMLLNKDTTRMKWIYTLATYLIPASVSWIPFAFGRFGFTGIQCSITYLTSNCEKDHIGLILLVILKWIPLGATLIITGPIYLYILYRIRRQGQQYTPLVEVARNTIYQQMLADFRYFKWFPLPFCIINTVLVIARLIIGYLKYSYITLWSLTFIAFGLEGGIVALCVTLNPNVCKRLNWKSFKAAWYQNVVHRRNVPEVYPITKAEYGDSIQNTN